MTPPPWPPVRRLARSLHASPPSRLGVFTRGIVAAVGLWLLVRVTNRACRRVSGASMLPTLAPGDLILVLPARRMRRGDLVVVRDPRHAELESVKRVVGLPGEVVELRDDGLLVDRVAQHEPYLPGPAGAAGGGSWDVPTGHVVVLGDNRARSTDSRTFGPVPLSSIVGRVALGPRRSARRIR